ncbi:MAG: dTMP kinase [Desulfobulbaceae bacterium]|nr:dTMP kinase [Desulfobulbaceae bacterium]
MERTDKGILIAVEGIDGTGKSTQVRLLADYLRNRGLTVVETREPTDGPSGRKIRQLFVDRGQCSPAEELALFIEDRRQHVQEVIAPALARGQVVVTDRYYYSTAAYQGAAGLDPDDVFAKNSFAPEPDLVILLIMEPQASLTRIKELRGEELNDFEQEDQLHRVAALFASFKSDQIVRIDADAPVHQVEQKIRLVVDAMLQGKKY